MSELTINGLLEFDIDDDEHLRLLLDLPSEGGCEAIVNDFFTGPRFCSCSGMPDLVTGRRFCHRHERWPARFRTEISFCERCEKWGPVAAGFTDLAQIQAAALKTHKTQRLCDNCQVEVDGSCIVCGVWLKKETLDQRSLRRCCSVNCSNIRYVVNARFRDGEFNGWRFDSGVELLIKYLSSGIQKHKKMCREQGVSWGDHKHVPIYPLEHSIGAEAPNGKMEIEAFQNRSQLDIRAEELVAKILAK